MTGVGAQTVTSAATTAVAVAGTAQAALNIAVNGGSTVTVNSVDQTTGTITVGATTAAAGAVSITAAGNYTDAGGAGADDVTLGAINVTGGTSISVTSTSGITAAEATAAKTATTNDTVTLSAVTATGNASTTEVTVTQDKAVAVAQAAAAIAEQYLVDFNSAQTLAQNESITVGGLTLTVTDAAGMTGAEIAAAFASLANGATTGSATKGTYSGALNGWSTGALANTDEINFTSATAGVNVPDLTIVENGAAYAITSSTRTAGAAAVEGVVGVTNGAVTIADVNAASTTAAGVIKTATLNNYGNSTINSGALETVNLSGTAGTLGVTAGALTTATVNTLGLNVNGVTKLAAGNNAITLDTDYKTLNLAGNTAASVIDNVTAAGVKVLNVSGDAKVTLTNNTFAALTDVVVTNTAGVTLGTTALGATVNFTGGAGADSIILSNAFEKAITMGAGDDVVTYGGAASIVAGKVGSVDAGEGKDTIRMTAAQADAADGSAAFNKAFTGFEVLDIATGAAATTINLAGINGVNEVVTRGVNAGATLQLDGFSSGGTLTLDGAAGSATSNVAANVLNALVNPAEVFNVRLSNSTADNVQFGTVTLAGIETVNISTVDAGTLANVAATQDSVTLVATAATSITVSGNNGLNIVNTGNTAVTSFDASGVVANGVEDRADMLGVSFTSVNNDGTKTVSITGGEGNDVLTGGAAKDTIVGGKGNDIITGGTGVDTLTGGEGSDTFVFAAGDAGITGGERITDFSIALSANGGDKLDLATTTLIANVTAANVTSAVGGAVDVTATVKDGLITLGGADAGLVNTVGHIKAIFELLNDGPATAAEVGAIVLNGQTYVLTDAAGSDSVNDIIQLAGVTTATGLSTVDAAGSIWIA